MRSTIQLGQSDEAFDLIRSLDDLDVDARENAFHRALELRPLVAGVGVELDQEREGAEQVLLAFRRRLLTGSPRPCSGQATRRQAQRQGSATGCGAKGLPI